MQTLLLRWNGTESMLHPFYFMSRIYYNALDGISCLAMPIPKLSEIPLVVKRSSAGLGLFASAKIKRGAYPVEYVGRVVRGKAVNDIANKYLFETSRERMIDGSSRSNIARYINHSCKPNCEIEIIGGRVFVHTLRSIKAGEELTYDYGEEYFNEYIKPYGCRCKQCKP